MVCGYTSYLFTYRIMKQLTKLIDQTIEKHKDEFGSENYWTNYNIDSRVSVGIFSKSKFVNWTKKLDCMMSFYDHNIGHDYSYMGYSSGSYDDNSNYIWEIEFDIIAVDLRKNSTNYYDKRFAYLSLLTFYHQCFQEWLHEEL